MKRKIILVLVILAGIYFAFSLTKQIWSLWQGRARLEDTQKIYQKAEEENRQLKNDLAYKESDEFVEKEAREKLNFAREGEEIAILPIREEIEKEEEKEEIPNWRKWLKLLFSF